MKRLIRPKKGRKVGGVSLALANYMGIDVTVVRVVFVFLALPGGFPGIIPYIVLWLVIPEE